MELGSRAVFAPDLFETYETVANCQVARSPINVPWVGFSARPLGPTEAEMRRSSQGRTEPEQEQCPEGVLVRPDTDKCIPVPRSSLSVQLLPATCSSRASPGRALGQR